MSYDIYIGEAEVFTPDAEDREEITSLWVVVTRRAHPEAPCFDNDPCTKNENHRHPGYSSWSEWCRAVGLNRLFFDGKDGLMVAHPGCVALRKRHHTKILAALHRWQKQHPGATPGFYPFDPNTDEVDGSVDPMLARLVWLEWWVRWSLANCTNPALYNS